MTCHIIPSVFFLPDRNYLAAHIGNPLIGEIEVDRHGESQTYTNNTGRNQRTGSAPKGSGERRRCHGVAKRFESRRRRTFPKSFVGRERRSTKPLLLEANDTACRDERGNLLLQKTDGLTHADDHRAARRRGDRGHNRVVRPQRPEDQSQERAEHPALEAQHQIHVQGRRSPEAGVSSSFRKLNALRSEIYFFGARAEAHV